MIIQSTDKKIRNLIDKLDVWPYIEYNFLDEETVNKILFWLKTNEEEFGNLGNKEGDEYWKGRSILWENINDPEIQEIMADSRWRVTNILQTILSNKLGIESQVYGEYLGFARWPVGYELRPHADSEEPNGREHQFPHRNFASIIYLNDDFEGCEIFFPNRELEMKHIPGLLIVFPGTLNYLHGIHKIISGVRNTIAMFHTFDSEKYDGI